MALLNSAAVEQAAVQRRHDLAAGQRVHRRAHAR